MADDARTAIIAATASLIVGGVSFFASYYTTKAQIQNATLTHAKDISEAVHESMNDLFFINNSGRVKTTLVGLYFLGESKEERKQIVETAGSAGTPDVRRAISYALTIDRIYGPELAQDPDVRQTLVSENPTGPQMTTLQIGTRDATPAKAQVDELNQTVSLLNGTGWVYLGLGPQPSATVAVDHDLSIKRGDVVPGNVYTLLRNVNLRTDVPGTSGLATSIGNVVAGQSVVILATSTFGFRQGVQTVWAKVFLCNAPSNVQRPPEASACPQAATAKT